MHNLSFYSENLSASKNYWIMCKKCKTWKQESSRAKNRLTFKNELSLLQRIHYRLIDHRNIKILAQFGSNL